MRMFSVAFLISFVVALAAEGREGYQKVQEVNFDGSSVDGKVRNPNGSYVVQRRGIDFVPLYNIRDQFDLGIKESVEHLKD